MGAVRSLHLHRPAHLYQYTTFSPLCRYLQPIDLITRGTEDSEGRHVNRWGLCVCSWGRWCSSACCWHTACLHAEVQARHVSPTCSAAACYCTVSRVKTVAGSLDMLDSFCSGLSGSMATWADTCGSELACVEPQPQRRQPLSCTDQLGLPGSTLQLTCAQHVMDFISVQVIAVAMTSAVERHVTHRVAKDDRCR